MGLTKSGFKRKTYEDLLNSMSAKAKEKFGQDANISEKSVLGILIRILSWFMSLLWQDLEDTYHSGYRKTAEGNQLDMLLPFAGITRRLEEHAYGFIEVSGEPGTVIPAGFLISTKTEVVFLTMVDETIGADRKVTIPIVAEAPGIRGNVMAGSIVEIINPTLGISSVVNPEQISGGLDKETDQEARDRADLSVEGLGSATTAAVQTELLKTVGVRSAKVIENYYDVIDQFGTPPRSIQAFVLGGLDDDIAYAINKKKAAGIQPYGTTYTTITDMNGFEREIGFTRADAVDVYVQLQIRTDESFPSDGEAQLTTAVLKYIGGIDSDSASYSGLNMGESVIISRIIAKAFSIDGVEDVSVLLSAGGTEYDERNIPIEMQQVAQTRADLIEVIVNV
ncbi:baseplate J/gp47 family protein [Lederbergia citrisecunda]|uniref:baseplate J/gp47 family protein n=1 Tax=Lederbergia citrisecunda TaxID=2833583 RepID=UPI003D290887